jgi:anaerobic magnesium-protoporphyrin IX monomethyl ester cyclase
MALDVLVVTPPSRASVYQVLSNDFAAIEPPVWAGLISNFIRSKGYSARMLDAEALGLTHSQTAARAAEADAKLTLFVVYGQQPSASTQCMPAAGKVAKEYAALTDRPSLVMGTHPSALPERTLREEPFTYVCQGEGPYTVLELLRALDGECRIEDVPGLWYWQDGAPKGNLAAPKIKDLDGELPGQAWDMLDMSLYRAHNWHSFEDLSSRGSYASLQTSLGCPYKCTFCCINAPFGGNGIRYWSPDNIIAQIDELVQKYGVKNIKIPDEMFVLNKSHVIGICDRIIDRGYDLNIWAYARIDTIQDAFIDKLQRAGFNWLGIGIESASKYVRDGVIKGKFDNAAIKGIVNKVRDRGINVAANYIFGLPDDTIASMQETLDMAMDLNTEWGNFYCAMAYPGSALYPMAKSKGWPLPDDPSGPGWIGYAQHAYDCFPLPTDVLTAHEVLEFRDSAFDIYFTNPAYLGMIGKKFGHDVVSHLELMTSHKLRRRHHDVAASTVAVPAE